VNPFRTALRKQELTLGAWVQIGHPAVAEICSGAGFDWVCVDLEHGIIDLETMADLFRAIQGSQAVPVARIPENDPTWIHRSLDAGARALIIPRVNSAAEAEAAVREALYPPDGVRGFGYSRANGYGAAFDSYCDAANDDIALIMQIEHCQAIPNLDDILSVDHVDGLFIGPLDLSGSMGVTGQMEHPEVKSALNEYLMACRRHKASAGMHIVRVNDELIQKSIDQGYTCIALGVDVVYLQEGCTQAVQQARRVYEQFGGVRENVQS
jgi:2-dehydro-3-deoxyglucarate aldolase